MLSVQQLPRSVSPDTSDCSKNYCCVYIDITYMYTCVCVFTTWIMVGVMSSTNTRL